MDDDLKYDAALPLYISYGKGFSIEEAEKALELAYSENLSVVIYIHGRAKDIGEPLKSEKKRSIVIWTSSAIASNGKVMKKRCISRSNYLSTFTLSQR